DWQISSKTIINYENHNVKHIFRDDRTTTPSPTPSPTLRALLNMKRKRTEGDKEERDQNEVGHFGVVLTDRVTSLQTKPNAVQFPMCDTFFLAPTRESSHRISQNEANVGDTVWEGENCFKINLRSQFLSHRANPFHSLHSTSQWIRTEGGGRRRDGPYEGY
ncbi:hypothetical protein PMAYCL1PPCAC_13621, partial [Pristionchus mayeri]